MKTLLAAFAALALMVTASSGVLEACGAKFLVATKAAKLQKIKRAANPGRILVYQHSDDPDDTPEVVEKSTETLRDILQDQGHTVVVARDEGALRDLSRGDDIDVVILGLTTARRLKGEIQSWSPGMNILPVTDYPTSAQRAAIKAEFGDVAVTGDGLRAILDSVEHSYQRN